MKMTTAAAAAGLVLGKARKARAAWPTTGTMAINPNIDNMRVVSCCDTAMVKTTPTSMSFGRQNEAVHAARVHANMDAMAIQLANTSTADAAWRAIFRSSKPWASTLVAIKINGIEPENMARVAVVHKLCNVFTGFGVPPANVVIYDGCSGALDYAAHFSPTDTSKIPGVVSNRNDALGGTIEAPIPGGSAASCTAKIADGTVDILVNIANNKGHSMVGGATLTMKNHFGTFAPSHDAIIDYMININKSDAIVGGEPVRQQLCIVDSLFANKDGNLGTPDAMPCSLVMGVFGPAVDYLTVKKIREEVLSCTHTNETMERLLTSFGYATTEPQWIVVPPDLAVPASDGGTGPGDFEADRGGASSGCRMAGPNAQPGSWTILTLGAVLAAPLRRVLTRTESSKGT